MKNDAKKEMLNAIEITRESLKNNMEITIESYTEVISKLDLITYLILNDNKIA